jgi:hypothetical protein
MAIKRQKLQRADTVKFKLNEPTKEIPGGPRRESVRVDMKRHPEIARRMRLNSLLLIHDPETVEESLAQIEPEDLPLLRRMATEGPLSRNEPTLRRKAIAVLGRFPTPDTLNLLTDLARYGDDAYVRGAALTALADTGVALAVPVITEGLTAKEPVEVRRAQEALRRVGVNLGAGRIREALVKERRIAVRTPAKAVLDGLEGKGRPTRRRRRSTSED